MKNAAYVITVIGFMVFWFSLFLPTYTNEEAYNEKYTKIAADGDTEQYHQLRDEYLTIKYPLIDYGLTIGLIGLVLMYIFHNCWSGFRTLPSKAWIVGFGVLAPLATVFFYVVDIFIVVERGDAPPWADSIGIPLMGAPIMLFLLFMWSGLNLIGLFGRFKAGVPVSQIKPRQINYWYLIISILTMLIILLTIIEGYFPMIVPGFMWLYFYLSLLAGRQAARLRDEKSIITI